MNDRPRGRRAPPPPEKTSPEIHLDLRAQSRRWHELAKLPSLRALLNEALEAGIERAVRQKTHHDGRWPWLIDQQEMEQDDFAIGLLNCRDGRGICSGGLLA